MEFKKFLESGEVFYNQLLSLRPLIAQAAQKIYDSWEQDDECDMGGICDEIASEIQSIVAQHAPGVETIDGGHDGDDHAWVIAYNSQQAFGIDIPPHIYETGGGYCWKKIPNVRITANEVEIWDLELNPKQISQLS
jgi:hypothetical protein